MKNKEHNIDSVKLMREIRDKLTEKYLRNPEQEMKDLEFVRKKYNLTGKATKEKLVKA